MVRFSQDHWIKHIFSLYRLTVGQNYIFHHLFLQVIPRCSTYFTCCTCTEQDTLDNWCQTLARVPSLAPSVQTYLAHLAIQK